MIRLVEGLSGRRRYAALYGDLACRVMRGSKRAFTRVLELIDVRVRHAEQWPPERLPETPLVMIANHPFGIGDGIAILSLAEKLDRPFRVMIAADLLKVPEIRPYALPIDFSETKEALKNNLAIRHETVRLLKEGVTVVIFPAGGVATAPKVLGQAEDLPWKIFVARLVQDAKASVIPIHFEGQNGRLFHLVSKYMNLADSDHKLARFVGNLSLTLRLSLLVREFARLSGKSIDARIGQVLEWLRAGAVARPQAVAGAPAERCARAQAGRAGRKAPLGLVPDAAGYAHGGASASWCMISPRLRPRSARFRRR